MTHTDLIARLRNDKDLPHLLRARADDYESEPHEMCVILAAADALEAQAREIERLREAGERLHGVCLDCYQPPEECNCVRAALRHTEGGGE